MNKNKHAAIFVLFVLLASAWTCVSAAEERDPKWAQPVTAVGVPNFYRITPNIYRSAQPSAEGMRSLDEMGIKTVINLRNFHSDKEELNGTGLKGVDVPMNTWHAEVEDVVRVLQILRNTNDAPFLIHCQHGADRTGTVVAMYRIVVQGWSKKAALAEMTEGGYGYHSLWKNLIDFIEEVDVEKIKEQLQ